MNEKIRLPKKYSAIYVFVITYMVMPLIPLLMLAIIYSISTGVIKSEILRSNQSILKQLQYNIDSKLADVEQLTTKIALDTRITPLLSMSKLQTQHRYLLRDIIQDCNSYLVANSFIENFYVYMRNADVAFSPRGTYDSQSLSDLWRPTQDISMHERLEESFSGTGGNSINQYFIDNQYIVYTHFLPIENPKNATGLISVDLKKSAIQGAIDAVDLLDQGTVAITDSEDNILFSSNTERIPEKSILEFSGETGIILDGNEISGQITATDIRSRYADWRYIYLVPTEVLNEKLVYIKNLMIIGVVFSLVIAALLTVYFVKMNYSPILKLIGLLNRQQTNHTHECGKNEYLAIQEMIDGIVKKNDTLQGELEEQAYAMTKYYLSQLITGGLSRNLTPQEVSEKYNIPLYTDLFEVFVFEIEDCGNLFGSDSKKNTKIAYFVIENVVREMLGSNGLLYFVGIEPNLVLLLNIGEETRADQHVTLMKSLYFAQTFIRENLDIIFSVGCSLIQRGFSAIPDLYHGALDVLEFKSQDKKGQVLDYAEFFVPAEASALCFYYGDEAKLENYIRICDFSNARVITEGILENLIRSETNGTREFVRYRMAGLTNVIMKVYMSLDVDKCKTGLNPSDLVSLLASCQTSEDYRLFFQTLLDEMERTIGGTEASATDTITSEIKKFVKANFQNPNLSLTLLSCHFNLTEANISKIFRKNAGVGLLEYIHRYRVKRAKELLCNPALSIKSIAAKLGFSNSDAFIRVFKKYEGITPGIYQEQLKNSPVEK